MPANSVHIETERINRLKVVLVEQNRTGTIWLCFMKNILRLFLFQRHQLFFQIILCRQ